MSGPQDGRPVSMDELRELWAALMGRGECWNGMTDHYLRERYGDRLYHVMGDGWYVRPAGDLPETTLSGGSRSSLLGSPFGRSRISADRASTPPAGEAPSYGTQP